MTNNPIFDYLFDQYNQLHRDGLAETEQGRRLFMQMMHYAPPEYLAVANQIAKEMNLIPEPDGYLDDGTPVISQTALAKHHGPLPMPMLSSIKSSTPVKLQIA